MLTQVLFKSLGEDILDLTLEDYTQGYILTNIEGLEPVKANIVATEYAQMDGAQYQSSYRGARDIRVTIELEPYDYSLSVTELRVKLYRFFLTKTPVTIEFVDDVLQPVTISGVVEDFTTELFSKTPSVTVQIYCADPDFVEKAQSYVTGVSGNLSYPFTYTGDVEAGAVLTVRCSAANNGMTIYHSATGTPTYSFQLEYNFLANDIVTISSLPGGKKVTLRRSGAESSIVYAMTAGSVWPKARPGINSIQVYQTKSGSSFDMVWTARHGGL